MKINRVKIKSEYRKELKGYHKIINDLSTEQRSEGKICSNLYKALEIIVSLILRIRYNMKANLIKK